MHCAFVNPHLLGNLGHRQLRCLSGGAQEEIQSPFHGANCFTQGGNYLILERIFLRKPNQGQAEKEYRTNMLSSLKQPKGQNGVPWSLTFLTYCQPGFS